MISNEGLTKKFNIPISHLDFDYIKTCSDVKELEKIYVTLKIGEEGKYPDLESYCEEKLKKICPESRVLRKPTELKTTEQLDKEQRDQLTNDFQDWLREMQIAEENMPKLDPTERGDGVPIKNYPIRGKQTITISEDKVTSNQEKKVTNKSCKPKDYNEWSKIADQLEKQMIVEENEESQSKPVKKEPIAVDKKCNQIPNLTSKVNTSGLSETEKEKYAMAEKDKGNEAFRAGDLEEADIYYCRSLTIFPTMTVYNNRGLIHMKQKKWDEAIRDLTKVLKSEPSNVKALMRRATCYSEIHNLQDAITDCEKMIKLSPSSKTAEALMLKCNDDLQKRAQPKLKDGRRMVITEVGSDEEDSENEECSEHEDSNKFKDSNSVRNNEIYEKPKDITTKKSEDTSEEAFMKFKDQGNELFKELKYEDALAIYDVLTKRWPSNPIGYRNKAACNLILERYEEVIKDCTVAIDLDKSSHLSFYRRGKAYKMLKQYEEGLKDLEAALEISPNHRQINDEVNEVKSIIYDEKMASQSNDEEVKVIACDNTSSSCANDASDIQRSSPMSGTWEFVEQRDIESCSDKPDEMTGSIIIVEDRIADSSSLLAATIERSSTGPLTKSEFTRKLEAIKKNYDWQSMIQLLVDVSPSNLASMIGCSFDGNILEYIISSLVVYSANPSHASFIKSVLVEVRKIERFSFVKLMVPDQTTSELDHLFDYLRKNCDNLAQVDALRLEYL